MWDSPSLAVDLFPRRWPSPTLRAITNFVLNFSPWNFQISPVLRFFCCWCFKVGCKLPATPQKLIGVWKFISCAGATSDRERRKAAPRQVDHNLVSCFFFLHLIGEMSLFPPATLLRNTRKPSGAVSRVVKFEISRKKTCSQMPRVAWERRDSWQLAGSSDPSGDFVEPRGLRIQGNWLRCSSVGGQGVKFEGIAQCKNDRHWINLIEESKKIHQCM